jgi:hypothetical protein
MSLTQVKKELNRMDKAELVKLVADLYSKVPAAKEFLDIYASGNVKDLAEKHKREIERYVYPKGRDMVMREAEARKLIRTVRKMGLTGLNVELELHYVKCCLDIVAEFGYYEGSYYLAMEKMFDSAMSGIAELGAEAEYAVLIDTLTRKGSTYGLDLMQL